MANNTAQRASCIFCKIVDGKQSGEFVLKKDNISVFKDIRPAAKNHVLSVPHEHIKDAKELIPEKKEMIDEMLEAAKEALRELGDDLSDVRFGFHWPPFHSVAHIHLHAISPASQMGFLSRMIFKENSYWFVSPEYVKSRL